MNAYHHALSSADKYGGEPEDYLAIHRWFDESKAFLPGFRHRALRHHAEGIFLAERIFDVTLTNSAGRVVPTRFIGEQHVKEDLGRIPTAQDWLECIAPQAWMMRSGRPDKNESVPDLAPAAPETPPQIVQGIKGGMIEEVFAADPSVRVMVVDRDVADDDGNTHIGEYIEVRPMADLAGTNLARATARAGQQDDAGSRSYELSPGVADAPAADDETRRFCNHYRCPQCGKTWVDEWSAACDDDCPYCGARHISPHHSDETLSDTSAPPRNPLTIGVLTSRLQRFAHQSSLGEKTRVCVSQPNSDYDDLLPPILKRNSTGDIVLLTPVCEGCGHTSGVRLDAGSSCSFEFELPAGFVIFERCDTCDRYFDDLDAAKAVADHAHWIHCANGHGHAIGLPRTKEDCHGASQAASL